MQTHTGIILVIITTVTVSFNADCKNQGLLTWLYRVNSGYVKLALQTAFPREDQNKRRALGPSDLLHG